MSLLGPNDGPGIYHVSPTLIGGAEIGFLSLGADQNSLGSVVLTASATVVVPTSPNDQAYDISVVANATNVCSVTAVGRVLTINLITNPNGFSLTPSTSANIEAAINASGVIKVLTPDGTPSRTFAAAAIGAAQNLTAGVIASGLGSCDVAKQIDGNLSSALAGFAADVPPMGTLFQIRPGVGSLAPFVSNNSGTGASNGSAVVDDQHPGTRQHLTGSTSSGAAMIEHQGTVQFGTSGHVWRYEAKFMIPTLSNGTDTVNLSLGFTGLTALVDYVNGAYIKVDSNTAPNFKCVTSQASTRTTTDSGIALVAGTWYQVVIVVTNASKVEFYIRAEGSAYPSTPTVTITTNIPLDTSNQLTEVGFAWVKSAGTTSLTCWYHYQLVTVDILQP